MRYPSLMGSTVRTKEIPALDGGLLAEGAMVEDGSRLERCVNFWWKDGALRNRPGLSIREDTLRWATPPVRYAVYGGTDEAVGSHRKFVVLSWQGTENAQVTVELVKLSPDGEESVSLVRQYTDGAATFAFFSESGGSGDGVRENGALLFFREETTEYGFRVLAEPEDREDSWVDVTGQVTVPVILWGGTGCETPDGTSGGVELEEENLLTPWFQAQYTSGDFPYYRLPKTGLDDKAVTVTLLTNEGDTLYFTVAAGTDLSPASGLYRVHLDRVGGTFYFCAATGAGETPVILGDSYRMNNITVKASKDNMEQRKILLGMKACIWFGGWQGLYSGNRLFIGGNPECGNRVYWSESRNPLYFPPSNFALVGGDTQSVTALAYLRDELIIFKSNEVYSAARTVLENPLTGREKEHFPPSLLSPLEGCDCPRTIRLCNDRLLWADSRGEVYCLKEADAYSNASVLRLGYNIASHLAAYKGETLRQAFAMDYAGRYLLVIGREAYGLDYTDSAFIRLVSSEGRTGEELRWFVWDFGEGRQIDAGVASQTAGAFLCRETPAQGESEQPFYTAAFDGDEDGWAGGDLPVAPVCCSLRTAMIGWEPMERRKTLRRLYVMMENPRGAAITYLTDRGEFTDPQILYSPEGAGETVQKLSPSLTGITTLRLGLECRGKTAVERLILHYTTERGAG